EDGIRDWSVTGVQTCALPIYAADAHAVLFQFGYRVEDQTGLAAESIQLEDQKLIELPLPGSLQGALAGRTGLHRHRPRNAVVGEDLADGQSMQFAVPMAELALRNDGLPLALFFGANSQVKGN